MTRALALWLVLLALASPVGAQYRISVGARRQAAPEPAGCQWVTACDDALPQRGADIGSVWPVAASSILPGSGQAMLGNNRAVLYLAVEAFAWTAYVKAAGDYRRRRNGYRDLASRVARAPFATVRPNGDFEYYEQMTHYLEAGRYDLVAGGGLDPETDSATYNGSVWLLARRTYWANPGAPPDTTSAEWQRAIGFYRNRAYDQTYRWSWTNAPAEYSMFLDLIRASNDANRRALQDLGIIIANHVLSTVDAFISVRLSGQLGQRTFAISGSLPLVVPGRRRGL